VQAARGQAQRGPQVLAVHGGHSRGRALDQRESPAAQRTRPVRPQAAHRRGRDDRPPQLTVRASRLLRPPARRRPQLQPRGDQPPTAAHRGQVVLTGAPRHRQEDVSLSHLTSCYHKSP